MVAYSNYETAHMIFMYGVANKNALNARHLYIVACVVSDYFPKTKETGSVKKSVMIPEINMPIRCRKSNFEYCYQRTLLLADLYIY